MIKFEHVSKTYPNGVKGLQDINLEIEDGEFVGIIGMSGAGKSTFIRTINRLNNITEGKLTVDGVEISNLNCVRLPGDFFLPSQMGRVVCARQTRLEQRNRHSGSLRLCVG